MYVQVPGGYQAVYDGGGVGNIGRRGVYVGGGLRYRLMGGGL